MNDRRARLPPCAAAAMTCRRSAPMSQQELRDAAAHLLDDLPRK
jgi:hypothetical protein